MKMLYKVLIMYLFIHQLLLMMCVLFFTESGEEVTDETNDLSVIYFIETENLESDEIRHKPLPKIDIASQSGMKTFLILKS